jgi:hypothetical protein
MRTEPALARVRTTGERPEPERDGSSTAHSGRSGIKFRRSLPSRNGYQVRPLHTLLGALLVLVVAGSLGSPASAGEPLHARQAGPASDRITWSERGSYVLGDSISALGSAELQLRRPGWSINAVHGRPVAALPTLVSNLRAVDQRPYRVVIELGSNQSPNWTKAHYEDAIAELPNSTRVLLVTPYKAGGGHWAPKGVRATMRYARWMTQIARQRPHTCVVPWRARASHHREWLRDGLHPTDDFLATWADLLIGTTEACR